MSETAMTVASAASGGGFAAHFPAPADRAGAPRFDSVFPLGTSLVNVTGSALAFASFGTGANHRLLATVGTVFPAALIMFSTFGCETVRWAEEGADSYAVANVVIGVAASLAAAFLVASIGQRVRP